MILKKYLCLALYVLPLSLIYAESILPEKTSSKDLGELASHSPKNFTDIDTSVNKRLELFIGVIGRANSNSPKDNRAYLFSLAIDLYNSIPPDLMPEPQKLGPDEDVYEPELSPLKMQMHGRIASLNGNIKIRENTLEENNMLLDRYKKKLLKRYKEDSSEYKAWLTGYFEKKYLRSYIREQVVLGNITIDSDKVPASIPADRINIYEPISYPQLKEYMASVQPHIDSFTPPWEVKAQSTPAIAVTKNTTKIKKKDLADNKTVKIDKRLEQQELTKEIWTTEVKLIVITLLLIVLLGLIYILIKRRKKKKGASSLFNDTL